MKLSDSLLELVKSLDRTHAAGYFSGEEAKLDNGFPDMVTSETGSERYFTTTSKRFLLEFTRTLYEKTDSLQPRIRLQELVRIVRQAVSDLHATDVFVEIDTDPKAAVKVLKKRIFEAVEAESDNYTHHFPAWTGGFEKINPVQIGPVWIRSRIDWVRSVDFHSNIKSACEANPEANENWQEILVDALSNRKNEQNTPGLAGILYGALSECPAVVSVTVRDAEIALSRKLARLVCKCALDCLSLGFGPVDFFVQQMLYEERLPPMQTLAIADTDGLLRFLESTTGSRMPIVDPKQLENSLKKMEPLLAAFAHILAAHIEPTSHKHPKLANRWSTALEWFAEGNRESNDSLALAKLGVSLDILSSGGENYGILNMLRHLTGRNDDDVVVKGLRPRTLKQLVSDIYSDGRSRILHGNHYSRMKDFQQERRRAMEVSRQALLECAIRLHAYSGDDADEAFRTMPSAPTRDSNKDSADSL